MGQVKIIENAGHAAVAGWLAAWLSRRFAQSSARLAITVPGGETPFPIIERLLDARLPWNRLSVWPNDDRIVPEDHPASNTGRLRALFTPSGAEVVTLTQTACPPRFALAWLGMGADGHIASLFPSADPQVDAETPVIRVVPDPLPAAAPFERVSLTIPALLSSAELLFVIAGAQKRAVFDAAMAGKSDLPIARLLAAAPQKITCFA